MAYDTTLNDRGTAVFWARVPAVRSIGGGDVANVFEFRDNSNGTDFYFLLFSNDGTTLQIEANIAGIPIGGGGATVTADSGSLGVYNDPLALGMTWDCSGATWTINLYQNHTLIATASTGAGAGLDTSYLFEGSNVTPGTTYRFGEAGNDPAWEISQPWIQTGVVLDLANPAVWALFFNGSNAPIDLGITGQLPTGTCPPLYFPYGAPATPWVNAGLLGPVSINSSGGTVTDASTIPAAGGYQAKGLLIDSSTSPVDLQGINPLGSIGECSQPLLLSRGSVAVAFKVNDWTTLRTGPLDVNYLFGLVSDTGYIVFQIFVVAQDPGGFYNLQIEASDGSNVWDASSNNLGPGLPSGWVGVIVSWDKRAGTTNVRISNVNQSAGVDPTPIDPAGVFGPNLTFFWGDIYPPGGVGSIQLVNPHVPHNPQIPNIQFSQLWWRFGQMVNAASLWSSFFGASNAPKNLGPGGAVPTGTQPEYYFPHDTSQRGVNAGSVGGTLNTLVGDGVITDASTIPPDGGYQAVGVHFSGGVTGGPVLIESSAPATVALEGRAAIMARARVPLGRVAALSARAKIDAAGRLGGFHGTLGLHGRAAIQAKGRFRTENVVPHFTAFTGPFPPEGPTGLLRTIGAYLYQEYRDDENLEAFVEAYNSLIQEYIDWFNDIELPIYTRPQISGALLDWVAAGLYGMTRPFLPTGKSKDIGPLNTWPLDTLALNEILIFGPVNFYATSDDIFRRILTWHFYKGDGKVFDIRWLKRRIMRFLYGVDGTAPDIDQTYEVSVTFGPRVRGHVIYQRRYTHGAIFNTDPLNTWALDEFDTEVEEVGIVRSTGNEVDINLQGIHRFITGGAILNLQPLNTFAFDELDTVAVVTPVNPLAPIFKAAVDSGVLELPFQYRWIVNIQ